MNICKQSNNQFIIAVSSLIFFLTASLLLYLTLNEQGHKDVDTIEYELVANYFAQNGQLRHPYHPEQMPSHTIGYHFFLGLLLTLLGYWSINLIICLQLLLTLLCFFLLYKSAHKLFGQPTAIIALVLSTTHIGFIIYPQMLYAEIVLLTFLIGFIYNFINYIYEQKIRRLMASGFMLGISVMVKPVALYFIAPLLIFVYFSSKNSPGKKIGFCVLFALCFYIPVIGYMTHNKIIYGSLCVTNLVAENLYCYFLPNKILPLLEPATQQHYLNQLVNAKNSLEEGRLIFWKLCTQQPFLFVRAWLSTVMKIFFGLTTTQLKVLYHPELGGGLASFYSMHGSSFFERLCNYINCGATHPFLTFLGWAEVIWLLVRYVCIAFAFIALIVNKEYFWFLFFGVYIGYFSLISGHDGSGRYRMMLEPLFILLTAYAIIQLYNFLVSKRNLNITQASFST